MTRTSTNGDSLAHAVRDFSVEREPGLALVGRMPKDRAGHLAFAAIATIQCPVDLPITTTGSPPWLRCS